MKHPECFSEGVEGFQKGEPLESPYAHRVGGYWVDRDFAWRVGWTYAESEQHRVYCPSDFDFEYQVEGIIDGYDRIFIQFSDFRSRCCVAFWNWGSPDENSFFHFGFGWCLGTSLSQSLLQGICSQLVAQASPLPDLAKVNQCRST
jgi:hypothetical protein